MMYIDFYVFFVSIFLLALGIYSLIFLGLRSPESPIILISLSILSFLIIFSLFRIFKRHRRKRR
ncbi:MAG: hypothetical protein DRP38_02475 [Thermotogae bacterium]|nr:MAG: hypothetical protein DRP38_02475 [Thermotogota bacterium]RKX52408.1 MAG: hypothetical protein DRP25_02370 [Thermotoga sp.]